MDYTEAITLLDSIQAGAMPDTDTALTNAITVYRELAARVKTIEAAQVRAKQIVTEIMMETGQTKASTPAGTAQFTADSIRVTWDGKALDALCASSPAVAELLSPHRTEKVQPGSLTIK
jgi:protoporphyrinogen oxidase